MTGSSTSIRIVKISSTTSQPSAVWPVGVCSRRLSLSTRVSTTVLLTQIHRPNIRLLSQPVSPPR